MFGRKRKAAESARHREALEWYARRDVWAPNPGGAAAGDKPRIKSLAYADRGELARFALGIHPPKLVPFVRTKPAPAAPTRPRKPRNEVKE